MRRIARALWPCNRYSGPIIFDGRERDAIFVTDDVVYYIEATISREMAKAKSDLKKLQQGTSKLRMLYPEHTIIGFFITLDEPSGHQGVAINQAPRSIRHVTFDQFRSRLIDAHSYLETRSNYPFGSAREPVSDAPNIPQDDFIEPALFIRGEAKPKQCNDIGRSLQTYGKRYVVLGDFGVGKSMLLKHIFLFLKTQNLRNHDHRFPVLLNLRDHREQTDPAEALHRHATRIGFDGTTQLVRAWRAGYVHLLLDGFDELPPRTVARETSRTRDIRRNSVELVRRFVKDSNSEVSIVIAGRSNFFGSEKELNDCLGISDPRYIELGEWSDLELQQYLSRRGYAGALPTWLPRRPLLVGYLVSRNLLIGTDTNAESEKAAGWLSLARHIYNREADQMEIGIDGTTLLHVAARLASQARTKSFRLGPINFAEAKGAFEEIVHGTPEDRAINALLRLPGLRGPTRSKNASGIITYDAPENSSEFFDVEYADVLSGIDTSNYLLNPYDNAPRYWSSLQHAVGKTGISVAASIARNGHLTSGAASASFAKLNQEHPASIGNVDIMNICKSIPCDISKGGEIISNLHLDDLEFFHDDGDMSKISFVDCYFNRVAFFTSSVLKIPNFYECLFSEVETWFCREDIDARTPKCEIEKFTVCTEGAKMLGEKLPVAVRVLIELLDRLYMQSVKGRQENTLFRGWNEDEKQIVPEVLEALKRHGGLERRSQRGCVVHPLKAFAETAKEIIQIPSPNTHPLVAELWRTNDL